MSAPTPNLSQYFASTTNSFFEGITQTSTDTVPSQLPPPPGPTAPPPPLVSAIEGDGASTAATAAIPDAVRDLWEPPPPSQPGRPPHLTTPGVQLASDLVDPIRAAVLPLLGAAEAQRRRVHSADEVTQDERGLRQLMAAGSLRAAVNLTGRLLHIHGQGYGRCGQPAKHSPHSLQLWFTRLALLTKLGMHELAAAEAEAFGQLNRADVYFEHSPEMYGQRRGSMAPFSMRLLLAELPMYAGGGGAAAGGGAGTQAKQSLDRLTELWLVCQKIVEFYAGAGGGEEGAKVAADFWRRRERRVQHSLVNCALQMRDFSLADTLVARLAEAEPLGAGERKAVYSAWGRMLLQCGDVFGAERKFSEARRMRDGLASSELRDIIDKGLIAVAQNDFQTAQSAFENALRLEPANAMLLNNLGVCSLYSGRLKEAIAFFEHAIQSAGTQNVLNDSLLLNLSTLYELESSNDVQRKLALLQQINALPADVNVNLEFCLKLQPANKIY